MARWFIRSFDRLTYICTYVYMYKILNFIKLQIRILWCKMCIKIHRTKWVCYTWLYVAVILISHEFWTLFDTCMAPYHFRTTNGNYVTLTNIRLILSSWSIAHHSSVSTICIFFFSKDISQIHFKLGSHMHVPWEGLYQLA